MAAYTPTVWKTGDTITAERLNHLEQGVQNEQQGPAGANGKDGVSPTVSMSSITGGTRVTIVDANGSKSFDVLNGKDGAPGQQGPTGPAGESVAGVSSFNDRDGAVKPQAGDYSAEQISFTATDGIQVDNVQKAIEALFRSGSEGKALVASAITAKGVQTAADATFQAMHDNILSISEMPDGVFEINLTADPPEGGTVSGGGYASAGMTCSVEASAYGGYLFEGWQESGAVVEKEAAYLFRVEKSRNLLALFKEEPKANEIGQMEVGEIVKLNIDGVPTDFIIVHQGLPSDQYDESCNGTWLWMKDIYTTMAYSSKVPYGYVDSSIGPYLNDDFIKLFDENVRGKIKKVTIPCNNRYANKEKTLTCNVFVLSTLELNFSLSNTIDLGSALDYFLVSSSSTRNARRIGYFNSVAATHWTRGLYSGDGMPYIVSTTGGTATKLNYDNISGVRPALILPSDTLVSESGAVIA